MNAQKAFNEWSKYPASERSTEKLLSMLDFDFFEVLDSVTIARSRKHIEKYYNIEDVGRFPERLRPISLRPGLVVDDSVDITYDRIFQSLCELTLSVYVPSKFIHPSKLSKYEDIYARGGKGSLSQTGRELGIRRLMAINLMKRMESSVYSFRLTLEKIIDLIEKTIERIEDFERHGAGTVVDDYSDSFDESDDEMEGSEELFTIGNASAEAKELFGRTDLFPNPKPVALVKFLCSLCTDKNGIFMDFFAGSSTTAHALMCLNKEDGGSRHYIQVQINEECNLNGVACKEGYKTICDIGEERIRRAGNKIKEEAGLMAEGLDVGFRVFRIDDSNMKDIYYRPDEFEKEFLPFVESNIKEDRTPEDLLFQVMIDDFGIPLSAKIETLDINGKRVFNVEDGHLVACFDSGVTDEVVTAMAKLEPNYAVLRDSS